MGWLLGDDKWEEVSWSFAPGRYGDAPFGAGL
jgi:hypothetical protein